MAILAGILTAVVGAGLSAGLAAASAPDYANPASSSRKVSAAQLRALPGQRQVEQAARLGQKVEYDTGKVTPKWEKKEMSAAEALRLGYITKVKYDQVTKSSRGARGNGPLTPTLDPETTMVNVRVKAAPKAVTRTADFTGYGEADVQGKVARSMAEIGLDLQKKYGADFVAEAKRQQELADPEGTAARRLMADEINRMEEERKTKQRPVAGMLDSQVIGELQRGTGLGDPATASIEQVLRDRGDTTVGAGDIAGELESGPEGEARKQARVQKALSYLSSGASPEDAAYREKQQSLANMASFLGGRTPQSQFKSLSGGQQGAAPQPVGPALPNVGPGGQAQANVAGLETYAQGIRNTANNVSPWFAGLSLLTKGLSTAGGAMTPQQKN